MFICLLESGKRHNGKTICFSLKLLKLRCVTKKTVLTCEMTVCVAIILLWVRYFFKIKKKKQRENKAATYTFSGRADTLSDPNMPQDREIICCYANQVDLDVHMCPNSNCTGRVFHMYHTKHLPTFLWVQRTCVSPVQLPTPAVIDHEFCVSIQHEKNGKHIFEAIWYELVAIIYYNGGHYWCKFKANRDWHYYNMHAMTINKGQLPELATAYQVDYTLYRQKK